MDTGIKIIKGLLIALLLLPSLAWGGETQIARMNPYILGAGTGAAAGPTYCSSATQAGTTTYLICEDFEGSADCGGTGDDTYCWNTWVPTGSVVFNADGIEGTRSAETDTAAEARFFYKAVTATDSLYAFFMLKIVDTPSTAAKNIFYLTATGTYKSIQVVVSTGRALYVAHGTISSIADPTTALTEGTTYYVWFGYTKSTTDAPENGTAYVCYSEDMTKPADPTTDAACSNVTVGDLDRQVNRVYFGSPTPSDADYVIDRIRISSTDIGSDPE